MRYIYADDSQTSIDSRRINGLYSQHILSVRTSFDLRVSRREKDARLFLLLAPQDWLRLVIFGNGGEALYSMALVERNIGRNRIMTDLIHRTYIGYPLLMYHPDIQINTNAFGL